MKVTVNKMRAAAAMEYEPIMYYIGVEAGNGDSLNQTLIYNGRFDDNWDVMEYDVFPSAIIRTERFDKLYRAFLDAFFTVRQRYKLK
jgi:hypothetical protein